jgi:hypothetical protein
MKTGSHMKPPTPPKIVAVEIVAAQPTEADKAAIAHLSIQANRPLPQAAYLVKVRLKEVPPATSHGWALYLGDFRIPKYWEYKEGIYFKVFDPQFFADHEGASLRFSLGGTAFTDSRIKLPASSAVKSAGDAKKLPVQQDLLE